MISLKDFGSEFWYESGNFHDLFKKVSNFALRLDGWKYKIDREDFTTNSIYENNAALLEGKEIPREHFLLQLFFIQRNLAKGQFEINNANYKIFYELSLKCLEKDDEIKKEYINDEYYEKWEEIKGGIPEIVKNIKNILETVNWK